MLDIQPVAEAVEAVPQAEVDSSPAVVEESTMSPGTLAEDNHLNQEDFCNGKTFTSITLSMVA